MDTGTAIAQEITGGAVCACGWQDFDLGWQWRMEFHQSKCEQGITLTSAERHLEQVEFAEKYGLLCYCGEFEDKGLGSWERYQEHRKVCIPEIASRESKLTKLVSFLGGS